LQPTLGNCAEGDTSWRCGGRRKVDKVVPLLFAGTPAKDGLRRRWGSVFQKRGVKGTLSRNGILRKYCRVEAGWVRKTRDRPQPARPPLFLPLPLPLLPSLRRIRSRRLGLPRADPEPFSFPLAFQPSVERRRVAAAVLAEPAAVAAAAAEGEERLGRERADSRLGEPPSVLRLLPSEVFQLSWSARRVRERLALLLSPLGCVLPCAPRAFEVVVGTVAASAASAHAAPLFQGAADARAETIAQELSARTSSRPSPYH
jgi:hypothetical protein